MKTNYGSVTNPTTGVVKDIIVSAKCGNKLKDILIGGGAVLAGIAWLTATAFKNGSEAYYKAEDKALDDAGLLVRGPTEEDVSKELYIHTDKTK